MGNIADPKLASDLWHRLELFSICQPDDKFEIPFEQDFIENNSDFIKVNKTAYKFLDILIANLSEFAFLESAEIELLWKLEGGKSKGNVVLGRCQKPSGLLRHHSKFDYIIWFAADHCRNGRLSHFQILALLYHELCHTTENDNGEFTTKGHEYEGFYRELELFGPWRNNAREVIEIAQKLPGF